MPTIHCNESKNHAVRWSRHHCWYLHNPIDATPQDSHQTTSNYHLPLRHERRWTMVRVGNRSSYHCPSISRQPSDYRCKNKEPRTGGKRFGLPARKPNVLSSHTQEQYRSIQACHPGTSHSGSYHPGNSTRQYRYHRELDCRTPDLQRETTLAQGGDYGHDTYSDRNGGSCNCSLAVSFKHQVSQLERRGCFITTMLAVIVSVLHTNPFPTFYGLEHPSIPSEIICRQNQFIWKSASYLAVATTRQNANSSLLSSKPLDPDIYRCHPIMEPFGPVSAELLYSNVERHLQ